ncbi:MAG: hypothetical protein P8L85_11215 [Rubripirellula sp.]|nr:hypothetical protein [Rubripirellula sp.]
MTLTELVVVMTILVALAGLIIPNLNARTEQAREVIADTSLVTVRDAVMQFWSDCKYDADKLADFERRLQMVDLFYPRVGFRVFDPTMPDAKRGWNGPYLQPTGSYQMTGNASGDYTNLYGAYGDPAVLDPWQRPLVIQDVAPGVLVGSPRDLRIVSAGADGVFQISPATPTAVLRVGAVDSGDDLYVGITLR